MDADELIPEELSDIPELDNIERKIHYTGTVVKTTMAGAIVDIGLGTPGVVHISQLQSEPVNRVEDVVTVGQKVDVWVRRVFPQRGRIELTMIPPLGLEWREIETDMVVKGTVVRLEKYGVFVDIGAERPGLVHISELSHEYVKGPGDVVKEGDQVEVKILKVTRKKKQIKLSIKALTEPPPPPEKKVNISPKASSKGKGEQGSIASVSLKEDQVEAEEYIPTAMEIAIRRAMEHSHPGDDEDNRPKKKVAGKKNNLEDIFAQTLQSRPSDK